MADTPASVIRAIEPLAKRHKRKDFFCGVESLDRYLKTQAGQDRRRRLATPRIAVAEDDTVVAYYTLSSFAIGLGDLPEREAKKLPQFTNIPATLLGRLAVDRRYHGRGLGDYMLNSAIKRALAFADEIASFAVVVDAINMGVVAFYETYGFQRSKHHADRLYLPIAQAEKLFQ